MRKLDIAKRIHREAGISEGEAATLLDWFFELLKATLHKGESISVANFGVFTVRSKAARKGRNPKTGEEVMILPRRAVTFRASPSLKRDVIAASSELRGDSMLSPVPWNLSTYQSSGLRVP